GLVLLLVGIAVAGVPGAGVAAGEPATIPPDVTVGGVPVGGLTADEADQAVRSRFAKPLVLLLADERVTVEPNVVGAAARVQEAIAAALASPPATTIPLEVVVSEARVSRYVDSLAAGFDRAAVDSTLSLRKLKPHLSPSAPGRQLDPARARESSRQPLARPQRTRCGHPLRPGRDLPGLLDHARMRAGVTRPGGLALRARPRRSAGLHRRCLGATCRSARSRGCSARPATRRRPAPGTTWRAGGPDRPAAPRLHRRAAEGAREAVRRCAARRGHRRQGRDPRAPARRSGPARPTSSA